MSACLSTSLPVCLSACRPARLPTCLLVSPSSRAQFPHSDHLLHRQPPSSAPGQLSNPRKTKGKPNAHWLCKCNFVAMRINKRQQSCCIRYFEAPRRKPVPCVFIRILKTSINTLTRKNNHLNIQQEIMTTRPAVKRECHGRKCHPKPASTA